jgi:hypothetical protein
MIAPSPCTAPGSLERPSERNYRSCCKGAEPCWRPCLRCAARTWRAGVRCPATVSPTSATPRSCWSWPISRAQQRNKWRVQGEEWRDHEIFARLSRIREGAAIDSGRSPKVSEFDLFGSGRAEIGQNHPYAKLYAQTLPREVWAKAGAGLDLSLIKNLVAVHRLREVSCLYGFTRFEAAPTSADGELEDVQLAVRGAPIARDAALRSSLGRLHRVHREAAGQGDWPRSGAVLRTLAARRVRDQRRDSRRPGLEDQGTDRSRLGCARRQVHPSERSICRPHGIFHGGFLNIRSIIARERSTFPIRQQNNQQSGRNLRQLS